MHRQRRSGFTLLELLVVLAILVLLFGLLFAPMMTSLDMARQGQSRAKMQDTVRYAVEDIRRTVGNALYVAPVRIVTPSNAASLAYADLSTLTVILPRRDSVTGLLLSPLQPDVRTDPNDPAATPRPWMAAVRYVVHPRSGRLIRDQDAAIDPSLSGYVGGTLALDESSNGFQYQPSLEDPFVLYRQTGIWYKDPSSSSATYVFGSFTIDDGSSSSVFLPNRPISENALTGVDGFDLPCTASVCDYCGFRHPGFRPYLLICPNCSQSRGYTHLFEDVTFLPERAAGEQLAPSPDGTLHTATHGGWTGYAQTDPFATYSALSPRKLEPRLVVYRYLESTGAYTDIQYDSYGTNRGTPTQDVVWNADSGTVRFGHLYDQVATLGLSGSNTTCTFSATANDTAVVSSLDPSPAATAPTGYRIDTYGTNPPPYAAIILPSTVKVRVVVNFTNSTSRYWDLERTEQYQQDQIGPWQFAVRRSLPPAAWAAWVPHDWATSMDLLFSSTDATGGPGPRRFEAIFGAGTIDSVVLHITYWARRNADLFRGATATGRDDLVRVDYNTRDVIDASVKLSEYADYVDDGSGNLTLPPPERTPKQASLSDTIIVRNAAR